MFQVNSAVYFSFAIAYNIILARTPEIAQGLERILCEANALPLTSQQTAEQLLICNTIWSINTENTP